MGPSTPRWQTKIFDERICSPSSTEKVLSSEVQEGPTKPEKVTEVYRSVAL
jgi:hypothetical protein